MNVSEKCRNIAIIGHLHHGKTSLLDLLISHAHSQPLPYNRTDSNSKESSALPRYLDSLQIERERAISLRCKPISLLLENSTHKSAFAVNFLDCPGHPDFREDSGVGLSLLCENVGLVVDCVEGVQVETEMSLKTSLNLSRPIVLILTKIERLWMELKLPPIDAYYKLRNIIDRLNTIAGQQIFAPELGNVVFASAFGGWAFTLESWTRQQYPSVKDSKSFSKFLWGDSFYSSKLKRFLPNSSTDPDATKRSFLAFVLEPLYKLYTQTLSAADLSDLKDFLSSKLKWKNVKESALRRNPRALLKYVLFRFFKQSPIEGLIDAFTNLTVSPVKSDFSNSDSLLMSICKVYPPSSIITKGSSTSLDLQPRVFCRLWQGSVRSNQKVFIHGGADEEAIEAHVSQVFIPCTRYDIPCTSSTSSPWVLLTGIPLDKIIKYGTITNIPVCSTPPRSFIPNTASHMRISIEPLVPSELPKMLHSLRLLSLLYPSLSTHVEESGEHVLFGPGELYLDCVLNDLRVFGQLQIRLSDPSVCFTETVQEISRLKCFADTANGRIRLTMIAEPLEKGLAELIEFSAGTLPSQDVLMSNRFNWDRLSCRSVMAVSATGGNVLIDDTFGEKADLLSACKSSIIQGFQWAMREGPLCEEPIRGVKFRLVDLQVINSTSAIKLGELSPAQIVPAARRCCYAAFLTASPRLLEPVNSINILAPADCIEAIYTLLAKRRGHVLSDTPLPGTPLYNISALLPLLDAPGFEVDLRVMTQGAAMCFSSFSSWQAIPGDPLDTSIKGAFLEPATPPALARDCLLKTRRRRGIGEDVKLDKYFDKEILDLLRK